MKASIKLSALFFLLSAGVFATTAAKAADVTPKAKEVVSFSVLGNDRGIKLNLAKSESGKSFVRVYNKQNELLLKDYVSTKTDAAKGSAPRRRARNYFYGCEPHTGCRRQ